MIMKSSLKRKIRRLDIKTDIKIIKILPLTFDYKADIIGFVTLAK